MRTLEAGRAADWVTEESHVEGKAAALHGKARGAVIIRRTLRSGATLVAVLLAAWPSTRSAGSANRPW